MPMPFDRKLTLRELFGALSGGQARFVWLIGLAVLSFAYIAGALIQSGRDAHNFSSKQQHFTTMVEELQSAEQRKDSSLAEFAIRSGELMQRLSALEMSFGSARADNDALTRQITFLNRYMAYANAQTDSARSSLVDSLCTLWRNGEKLRVKFERQPIDISLSDITQGRVTTEIQTFLVENFISLEPLQRLRAGDVLAAATPSTTGAKATMHQLATASTNADQAFTALQKQLAALKVLKSISFSDGSRFDIPRPVAVAVQIRRECSPF
jgi:hypothetical protein